MLINSLYSGIKSSTTLTLQELYNIGLFRRFDIRNITAGAVLDLESKEPLLVKMMLLVGNVPQGFFDVRSIDNNKIFFMPVELDKGYGAVLASKKSDGLFEIFEIIDSNANSTKESSVKASYNSINSLFPELRHCLSRYIFQMLNKWSAVKIKFDGVCFGRAHGIQLGRGPEQLFQSFKKLTDEILSTSCPKVLQNNFSRGVERYGQGFYLLPLKYLGVRMCAIIWIDNQIYFNIPPRNIFFRGGIKFVDMEGNSTSIYMAAISFSNYLGRHFNEFQKLVDKIALKYSELD